MASYLKFLVSNFSTFSDLKKFAPDEAPLHPVVKTEVIPMKILFRDEKYISKTIEVLTKLVEDAKLCGEPQSFINQIKLTHVFRHTIHDYNSDIWNIHALPYVIIQCIMCTLHTSEITHHTKGDSGYKVPQRTTAKHSPHISFICFS